MSELDDIDALAAEYVLGTLPAGERASVAARRGREAQLDAAITAWEVRLTPMLAVVPEATPSPQLFDRIRDEIRSGGSVVELSAREATFARSARTWRAAALGMGALAACLAGVIGWRELPAPTAPTKYVALLQAGSSTPGLMLSVDTAKQVFTVRALSKPQEQGKAYELWLVNDKLPAPKSLGLVPEGNVETRALDNSGIDRSLFMNATFAVSLEPEGGSPTGQPTGPVLFSGKLYQLTP